MEVVIVGAGIGGLVTALALYNKGHKPVLYESVGAMREWGVGINLLPHAVRVLTELGLAERLLSTGIETAELLYFSKHGQRIWREPRGLEAGYAWPQISIHRGVLHGILQSEVSRRLGPDAIRTSHHLATLETHGSLPRLCFVDRVRDEHVLEREADLVIGADGIHSVVRSALYPDERPPIWNGAILWRAITESAPILSGRSMFMAGHANQKFVCYPISKCHWDAGRSLTNWVAELRFDPGQPFRREDWSRGADIGDFLPSFETWCFDWLDIPALIRGTDAVLEYPMVDKDPVERWSFGPVTLLGDAAHPMYPIGSNGASQAILDADALARAMADYADPVEALQAYEQERLTTTSAIVWANRGQGPEQVMQMVEDRAPDGFADLDDVISQTELETIAARYKKVAGFDRDRLNRLRDD
ncbi:MAG: flavin-dependent oxidoreductase [Rhodospirillaceae bacterium]|nr:flavin-dependent oxidoreductase [Rhodospirillaceae bacterium]